MQNDGDFVDVILLFKRFAERWLLASCSREKLNFPDLSEEIRHAKEALCQNTLNVPCPSWEC